MYFLEWIWYLTTLFLYWEPTKNEPRREMVAISGGFAAKIENFPYQASIIQNNVTHVCGATIIDELWIITAAHCTSRQKNLTVQTGTDKLTGQGTRHKIANITEHPNFKRRNYDNDIALIKLTDPIKFTKKQRPIEPANSTDIPQDGQFILISGFGYEDSNSVNLASTLRKAYTQVFDQVKCFESYEYYAPITDNMFCAGGGVSDACNGDSGGPAVINFKLYGIISTGKYCSSLAFPGVYTRVHLYYDWIVSTTGLRFENKTQYF